MSQGLINQANQAPAPDVLLAMNLITARTTLGWTQEALSAASRISRATIAQLEAGDSDPRLSTIAALAKSLGLPPSFLLVGPTEVGALARLEQRLKDGSSQVVPLKLLPQEVRLIQEWLDGGSTRDRAEVIRLTVKQLGTNATDTLAQVLACIFTTFVPDRGLALGATLGELLVAAEGRSAVAGGDDAGRSK